MNTRSLLVGIVAAGVICSSLAMATPEFVPIQERAEGQSMSGSTLLNDSLYSNPAASAFTQAYNVEGTYGPPRSFAASVLDTRTSSIGGGFGYFRVQDYSATEPVQGLKLALNGKASNVIALGLGGKIMWGQGTNMVNQHLNDVDAGMLANLGIAQVGYTIHNIFGGNAMLNQDRDMAVGARIGYEGILFLNATMYSLFTRIKPYQFGIGAEYDSPYYFALKGGYRIDNDLNQNFWSAGLSFLTQKVNIHYALEFSPAPGVSTQHTLALSLEF
jgi:hypothetical protein